MKRVQTLHAALPTLMALSLCACGPAPQVPVGAAFNPVRAGSGAIAPEPGAPGQAKLDLNAPAASASAGPAAAAPTTGAPGPAPDSNLAPAAPTAGHHWIAFASDRETANGGFGYGGSGNFGIYLYDRDHQTVVALPGINSGANQINPRLSHNNEWLAYASNANGPYQIFLYHVPTQTINALSTLNLDGFDHFDPSISDDGRTLAYITREPGFSELRLLDVPSGINLIPVSVARLYQNVRDPDLSADGNLVAFSAWSPGGNHDVYLYDRRSNNLLSPPFVNTTADEDQPNLSADGTRLAFVSNRFGYDAIFVANLQTGYTNNLATANAAPYNQTKPRFLGTGSDEVLFQSDRTGVLRLFAVNLATGILDTLPAAHEVGHDDFIDNGGTGTGSSEGPADSGLGLGLGFGFGGFGQRGLGGRF